MTALYEISAQYLEAMAGLADLDLPPECVADTLEGLQGELTDKLRAVIAYAQTLQAEADMVAKRADELAARAKATSNRADSLRTYALNAMVACGIAEVKTADFVAKWKENPPSVVVDDDNQIPATFMRQPETPPPAPDKKAILAAMKEGQEVAGCHLERRKRLDVR